MKFGIIIWVAIFLLARVAMTIRAQPIVGECETAPRWTVEGGRDVMSETRGNVTLVALMELHCSFCRSQIEGFLALSKMLKNQSVNEVQFIIVAPWNESIQYIEYYRRYLEPTGIKLYQETADELVWSKIRGNKDDFFVYDACGRLSYYIPYPQSYLYYHYTVSTLYSTLRQEKCGTCRYVAALKVRAYLNVMGQNATTHNFNLEGTVPPRMDLDTPPTLTTPASRRKPKTKKPPIAGRPGGQKFKDRMSKTTTNVPATTVGFEDSTGHTNEDSVTPFMIDMTSGEGSSGETIDVGHVGGVERGAAGSGSKEATTSATGASDESTAQIPMTTLGTTPQSSHDEDDMGSAEDPTEDDDPFSESDYVYHAEPAEAEVDSLNGGGAAGSVGLKEPSPQSQQTRYQYYKVFKNGTRIVHLGPIKKGARVVIAASSTSTSTSTTTTTTTHKPITTSWSIDPDSLGATTQPSYYHRRPSGVTRVPKLSEDADCTPYTTSMCYKQWQEFGTLHPCCQRGVYLTDVCKAPLCNNATYHLCCFQKYQQARFQCCHDSDLTSDRPDDFSRCCYRHFVFDDDGNGDNDDQCCPKSIATYFWTTQTRVAELCLPNVELDLDGIVLEARMSDKSSVRIPLQDSAALQYECPYVEKRTDFFYWEPDGNDPDGAVKIRTTTLSPDFDIDIPE